MPVFLIIGIQLLFSCSKEQTIVVPPVKYSVTVTKIGMGSVNPLTVSDITSGGSVTLVLKPDAGYSLYSIVINNSPMQITPTENEFQYTISGISSNKTVAVKFVKTDILLLSKLEPALKLIRIPVYRADNNQYIRSVVLTQEEKARKLYHYYPSMDVKVISSDGSLYWSEKWDLIEDSYKQGGQTLKKVKLTDYEFDYQTVTIWSNADNCYIYYIDVYERI